MINGHRNIYCPKCNRRVASWDGKSTINIVAKCEKCKKLVVFRPDTMTTIQKDLPYRATSSGMTYI